VKITQSGQPDDEESFIRLRPVEFFDNVDESDGLKLKETHFNSRSGCIGAMPLCCCEAKRPNLKLKSWPKKQLLGYLP
jgi:hypothetical protein